MEITEGKITVTKTEYAELIRNEEKLNSIKKCLSDRRCLDLISVLKILELPIDDEDILVYSDGLELNMVDADEK